MPRCLPSIICQKNCSTIFHLQYAAANGCQVLFLYPSFAKCKSMFFDHWDVNFLCISALNFLFFFPCAIHLQMQQQTFLILGWHFLRYYFLLCRVQQQTFLALAFWFICHLSNIYKMEQLWTLLPLCCQLITPLALLSNKQQQMFLVTGLPVSLPSFPPLKNITVNFSGIERAVFYYHSLICKFSI